MQDMVYRGDPDLLHLPDGRRAAVGSILAHHLDGIVRVVAEGRSDEERNTQAICPGCYMVVGINMMITLAAQNGQDMKEMAQSMSLAFADIAANGIPEDRESIYVCR